jgi:hypothetical protein
MSAVFSLMKFMESEADRVRSQTWKRCESLCRVVRQICAWKWCQREQRPREKGGLLHEGQRNIALHNQSNVVLVYNESEKTGWKGWKSRK